MQQSEITIAPKNSSIKIEQARDRLRILRARVCAHFANRSANTAHINPSSPPFFNPRRALLSTPSRPAGRRSTCQHVLSTQLSPILSVAMDGSGETQSGWSRQSHHPVAAIFIHAGAGYHSTTNERIHLSACADAAKVAMRFLRGGGSAVEAIEAAIRVLEDKEITNAGYGSNLTIEGVVECDATVVDHLGRSGACGAVAKIKNPIHLARIILEESNRPLSLRRVPPNLLIADGAAEFGWEHGIDIVHHDVLVSKNARDRFLRWREDLRRAAVPPRTLGTPNSEDSTGDIAEEIVDNDYEEIVRAEQRRDHFHALVHGTWNEGQADSPQAASPSLMPDGRDQDAKYFAKDQSPSQSPSSTDMAPRTPGRKARSSSPTHRGAIMIGSRTSVSPAKRPRYGSQSNERYGVHVHSMLASSTTMEMDEIEEPVSDRVSNVASRTSKHHERRNHDGSSEDNNGYYMTTISSPPAEQVKNLPPYSLSDIDEDLITDTVGAIAIDMFGNIAAGSSSGGIGMKHRGRVGPAALVGIGTAVIPADFEDSDNVTVAAVTSGTGEHMATTMASQKCAERLYFCTKRGRGGTNVEATEEEAMESFVVNDFMNHPGVKSSHSAGAIGIMAVKKTPYGYFLHFAHNTDSFALASMHSGEKEPKCVMSRLGDHGTVVQGGRKIRVE